ncbi:MAG: hypothetical protein R3D57_00225 [Hyphomicrobiaceae bacterium]
MSAVSTDIFHAWTDLAFAGFRAYANLMQAGLETAGRVIEATPSFPAPAIRRNRPTEVWPAAGSFGGANAVAVWSEAASAMMGLGGRPRDRQLADAFNPFAWLTPARPSPFFLWMGPMTMAPTLLWQMPRSPVGWPMSPWSHAGWPMSANPFDPFGMTGMMKPMLEAMVPAGQRSFRFH